LSNLFGLTAAEARIASGLVGGKELREVADEHGIGFETARSQLKAVFAKTETHRQSDLIAQLSKIAAFQAAI
jgi:DNA-binding CsgD family transcriptional regulator